MKTTVALTAAGLLLAGFATQAQTPPPNHWDITKVDVSKLPPVSTQEGVTFDKDIQPLFKASCVGCHGAQRPRGGFRVDSLAAVLKGGREGKMVVPGDSKASLLAVAVAQTDPQIAMPPKRRARPAGAGGPPPEGGPGGPAMGGDGAPPPGAPAQGAAGS